MVADFSLDIASRVVRCGELVGDIVFGIEADYLLAGKIYFIFRDECVGNPEAAYYVLPEELDNFAATDLRERHCLNPLGKVDSGIK